MANSSHSRALKKVNRKFVYGSGAEHLGAAYRDHVGQSVYNQQEQKLIKFG
jgi:hypothetical protein